MIGIVCHLQKASIIDRTVSVELAIPMNMIALDEFAK
jgi:hypothetical protein